MALFAANPNGVYVCAFMLYALNFARNVFVENV